MNTKYPLIPTKYPLTLLSLYCLGVYSPAVLADTLNSLPSNQVAIAADNKSPKGIDTDVHNAKKVLPTIVVHGATSSDNPYMKGKAVSNRQEDTLGIGAETILRDIPGVFTNHNIDKGGALEVNIRGFDGAGHVNVMVDGITQTGYQANPGHGDMGTSAFVDDNLIAGIDVSRGAVAGSAGVNAMMGAVNFRTIDVKDILAKNERLGGKVIFKAGNNGYGNNGMVSLAAQNPVFSEEGRIGLLAATAYKHTSQSRKNGLGLEIEEHGASTYLKSNSGLVKFELAPSKEHQFKASYLKSRNQFANNWTPMQTESGNALLEYKFNPLSDLVNTEVKWSRNIFKQKFLDKKLPGKFTRPAVDSYKNAKGNQRTDNFEVNNISEFDFGDNELAFSYGARLFALKSTATDPITDVEDYDMVGRILPQGEQNIRSLYANLDWTYKKFIFNVGGHYEQSQLKGYMPPCPMGYSRICTPPEGDLDINLKNNSFNPYIGLAYQANDWFMPYVNYSISTKAPNITDVFYPIPTDFFENEAGDYVGMYPAYNVNPYLKPERAKTAELGFNIMQEGLLKEDDKLRLKVNVYHTRINNAIVNNDAFICYHEERPDFKFGCLNTDGLEYSSSMQWNTNSSHKTTAKGIEIEGGYDWGRVYSNFFYSRQKSDVRISATEDMFGLGHATSLPDSYWSLDFGSRWLDNKLTLGTKISKVGSSKVRDNESALETMSFDAGNGTRGENGTFISAARKDKARGALIDLYALYAWKKGAHVFFNVQNLTNKAYSPALSRSGISTGLRDDGGAGVGRSFNAGISMKF